MDTKRGNEWVRDSPFATIRARSWLSFRPSALWLATAIALVGTVANMHQLRWGFACWLVSNTAFAVHNARLREWPQALLFTVYAALAVWGLAAWR